MKHWLALALLIAACGSSAKRATTTTTTIATPAPTATAAIIVTSSAFHEGDTIPVKYTCSGAGMSPPMAWSGLPNGTGSVAAVVDDPDAPGRTFVHWVVTGLPPAQTSLAEGSSGFRPPCPPPGSKPHRYRFSVYALKQAGPTTPDTIRAAAVASGTLTATFSR